ncbi:oxygenase MpaB family protein [Smaragdicoccus niigatensis]|uniref:oxygenase MpaB family protein n=1 Tax=Smaragdicoccus niigatensis TaxID=359359 RepID=UPI000365B16A|nr:oxygenase MpaB family protein [Smaragdicoccus niigatensis]
MTATNGHDHAPFQNKFDEHVGDGLPILAEPDASVALDAPRLGADSLIWKYFGDWRVSLFGFQRIAGTETVIAQIGTALYEHSAVWNDALGRGQRTIRNLMQVIYGDDQQAWGHKVRDYHKNIKGSMDDGTRYHALSPELWYWIHATFVDAVIYNTDMFVRRLSYAEKVQIFEEGKAWYRLYGVSDRSQPQTYDEFLEYWEDMVSRAVPTHTLMYGTGYLRKGVPRPKGVPGPVWKLLSAPLNVYGRTMIVGTLPPQVRATCGLEWNDRQEKRFQRGAALIRRLNPVFNRLPVNVLYQPRAADAWAREGIDPRKIHNKSIGA